MDALLNLKLGFSLIFAFLCQTVAAQNTEPTSNLGSHQMTQQKSAKDADNDWLKTQLAEIEKSRIQVEKYNPLVKGYLVGYSNRDYILLAVSPKAREKWLKNENAVNIQQSSQNKLNAALEALAVVAAEKLPIYRTEVWSYTIRSAAKEELMKKSLPNLATLEIHQIGLKQMNWLIAKDDNGQPTARRRSGVILARDRADDHPFCWLYYVDVVEDFVGGKYGDRYGKLTTKQLIGCPLAAK